MRSLLSLSLLGLLAGCPRPSAFPASPATVHAEIVHAPEPARIGAREVLAYEVIVRNASDDDVTLRSLAVTAEGFTKKTLEGGALLGRTKLLLEGDAASAGDLLAWRSKQSLELDDGEVPPHRSAAVFLWLEAPATTALPPTIHHELVLQADKGSISLPVDTTPSAKAPIVLSPPLRGAGWYFVNGLVDANAHTRTLVPIHGKQWGAQRFAADILRIGPDGRALPKGASVADNSRFYGYGADVVAVADATVARVRDGIPENRGADRAVTITLDTITGNAVFLDVGGGAFAFYAHLQPGSIRVKEGDRVHEGQVIGKLGHSGNSSAPHLHFHVCTAPTGLDCEGLPYVFDGFVSTHVAMSGQLDDEMSFSLRPDGAKVTMTATLPEVSTICDFPAE